MTITIRRCRIYLVAALLLWGVATALVAIDFQDETIGNLGRIGMILSVPAATLTVLSWLEAHVTTIAVAFKAGVSTAEVKHDERTDLARWN